MNIDDLVLNPSDKLFYKKFTDVPFTGEVFGEESGIFKNGKRKGLWKYYFETGLLSERGYYKKGRRDGFWEARMSSHAAPVVDVVVVVVV